MTTQVSVDQLVNPTSTDIAKDYPVFDEAGSHQLVKDKEPLTITLTLRRPNAAQGDEFSKWMGGERDKKGRPKPETQPSQAEICRNAVKAVCKEAVDLTDDQVSNLILRTGGLQGDLAELPNDCLRLLGINLDEEIKRRESLAEDLPTGPGSTSAQDTGQ